MASQRYQQADTEKLIALWHVYNLHLAHLIKYIDPAKLHVSCSISSYPPVPLSFLITDYVAHLQHHLAQIMDY